MEAEAGRKEKTENLVELIFDTKDLLAVDELRGTPAGKGKKVDRSAKLISAFL